MAEPIGDAWIEKPIREVGGLLFQRFVIKTHLIQPGERLERTLVPYFRSRVEADDIVVLGEKIVAIAQRRAVAVSSVHPRPMARFLARHVRPLGYGLGLRRPETMEVAMREVGEWRIVLAALGGLYDHLRGQSGHFYRIAGRRVAAIDGPGPTTIPPYNRFIVLSPKDPQGLVAALARRLHCHVAVVDVNDVGSEVLVASPGVDHALVQELMRDNPMGQGAQGTPVAVLRPQGAPRAVPQWPQTIALLGSGWVMPMAGSGDSGLQVANASSEGAGDPRSIAL